MEIRRVDVTIVFEGYFNEDAIYQYKNLQIRVASNFMLSQVTDQAPMFFCF